MISYMSSSSILTYLQLQRKPNGFSICLIMIIVSFEFSLRIDLKHYRQNAEITPRPIMHNPPYDTGGTLTTNPAIAKPMPEQIVINSPHLR